jgi:hypothetical protein
MKIYVQTPAGEIGPMGLEELRDHLDLRMVEVGQACRIGGAAGRYVVGELLSGGVFADLARAVPGLPGEDDEDDEDDADEDEDEDELADGEEDENAAANGVPEVESGEPAEPDDDEEAEEFAAAAAGEPLWRRHPVLAAFPSHLMATCGLALGSLGAWLWEWSGWLAACLASLASLSLGLLVARRDAVRVEIFPDRIELQRGLWRRRRLVVARGDVLGLQARRATRWRPDDLLINYRGADGRPRRVRVRGLRGTRAALAAWRPAEDRWN